MRDLLKLQKLSHELLNARVEYSDLDHMKQLFRTKQELGYHGYLDGNKLHLWNAFRYSTIFTLELEDGKRVYSSRMHPIFRGVFLTIWLTAITIAIWNYDYFIESLTRTLFLAAVFSAFYLLMFHIYKSARSLEFDELKTHVYQTMENMEAVENDEPAPYERTDFKAIREKTYAIEFRIFIVVLIVFIIIKTLL